ncbi:MAG: YafY family transcriptional regulator [Sphingobacteriales bacterium]|nr:MAG: YafY family transcriptional regulator [Sphingobacteriales bacterium]
MNRIDRVCAMLIQLQSRKLVRAQDLAERFSISLRTVYRDIKTLEEAGVPVIGEAGSGYTIMEGYRLPPVMFTREEATAFITAGKLVGKLTDQGTAASFDSALYKVKAVLRSQEKDHVEEIEDRIAVVEDRFLPKKTGFPESIPLILEAISGGLVIRLAYQAPGDSSGTERNVEPVGIFFSHNHWYLIAFCRLRLDYRHFRLDRIRRLTRTDDRFRKIHPALTEFLKKLERTESLNKVIISVEEKVLRYMGDQKYYNGFVSQTLANGRAEIVFLTGCLQGFARWYLSFGEHAEIITPLNLKEEVAAICSEILEKVKNLSPLLT